MNAEEQLARWLAIRDGYEWQIHPGYRQLTKQDAYKLEANKLLQEIDKWRLGT